jgi:hypothetical protein
MLFLSFVLSASTSLRGASRSIQIVASFFGLGLPIPSWYAGRLWLLRIGYYKLTREKEEAKDWVWIIDHSVQLGDEKCLVILGIRLCSFHATGSCLTHENVEPIALLPVKHSNGDIVYQQLEDTVKKTGVPREIIGDHGSDLKSGIERFCHEHQETCYIYDIKHKIASVLKEELKDEEAWNEFVRYAAETKRRVQQTPLAALAPPNQRTKARYMNVEKLVKWGLELLIFFQKQQNEPSEKFDPTKVNEKLNWIIGFRDHLSEWQELIQIVKTAESFIKVSGVYRDCHIDLIKDPMFEAHTDRGKNVRDKLLKFIEEESLKAGENERLLGSSEIIESVFGKLKMLEQDQVKSGFTGLLLGIPALVSKTSIEVVKKAIETVPTKKVLNWCKKNIGQSVQSKRKEVFSFNK